VAQTARQQLAQDIFNVLRAVTGAGDPAVVGPTGTGSDPGQFNALRWLAQLAVNIVDYIDADDIMTPFNWFTDTTTTPPTPHWVYGTELPHVLLNEAVAAYTDPAACLPATVTVYVELLNPVTNVDASLPDWGAARLETLGPTTQGIYRVLVCRQSVAAGADTATFLLNPQNPRGGLAGLSDALM